MPTCLTDDALEFLQKNGKLQAEVSEYVGIQIDSVINAIRRKSKSLTSYKAVIAISKAMNVLPEQILIEKDEND